MTDPLPPADVIAIGDPDPADDEAAERASLDGHTLEELDDYLDRSRIPAIPSIDDSSACQIALDGLERLRRLSSTMLETEAEGQPPLSDGLIGRILELIGVDAQAGRDIPLDEVDDDDGLVDELSITEGAVRGIIRSTGDRFEGILLGRSRLEGDVTRRGDPITVVVDASVFWGRNVLGLVGDVRAAIVEALAVHTRLNVVAVNVTVHDVQLPPLPTGPGAADDEGSMHRRPRGRG